MNSLKNLIETLEKQMAKLDRDAPEDDQNYADYNTHIKMLRDALINDCEWGYIFQKLLEPMAILFKKMQRVESIFGSMCQFITTFKFYGKFLRKKAFIILVNSLKRVNNQRFSTDIDIIKYACLDETSSELVFTGATFLTNYSENSILHPCRNTDNHLRTLQFVYEFYDRVFIKKDYRTYYDLTKSEKFKEMGIVLQSECQFFVQFCKKLLRYLIETLCSDKYFDTEVSDWLKKLKVYCMKEINGLWRNIFCNVFFFKSISSEMIYHFFTNTNYKYLDMIKTFFVKRRWEFTVYEDEVLKIDYDKILFNAAYLNHEQAFNFPNYELITFKITEFVNAYFQVLIDRPLEGMDDAEYLKTYRTSYLIFHPMIQDVMEKNGSVLKEVGIYRSAQGVKNNDNYMNIKVSKALDKYVACMRFLLYVNATASHDYFLRTDTSKENEVLKYHNFNSILDISTITAELHLVSASTVCNLLQKFIDCMNFTYYKHLVLERFFIFVIMLKKMYKVSRIFMPYFEYILNEVTSDPNFNQENYFWVSLYRRGMIFQIEDVNSTDSLYSQRCKKLLDLSNKLIKKFGDAGTLNIIEMIFSKMKYRCHYEQYVYICSIREYASDISVYNDLENSDEFKKKLKKLVSKIVDKQLYHITSDLDKFSYATDQEFIYVFFELICEFNIQINEYYKIPKMQKFKDQTSFIESIERKLLDLLLKRTNSTIEHSLILNIIEQYKAIEEINKNSNTKTMLKLSDYLESTLMIPGVKYTELNRKKVFLSVKKESLLKYFEGIQSSSNLIENDARLANIKYMLDLNSNIKYEKEEIQVVIHNIILIDSFLTPDLGSFLVKENVFNSKNLEQSKFLIETYLNNNIKTRERQEVLKVVSILRLMKTAFNDWQNNINRNVGSTYRCFVAQSLRAENSSDFLQHKYYKKLNSNTRDDIDRFNKSYNLWRNIWRSLNRDLLVENLYKLGCFKICLSIIEEFANDEMLVKRIIKSEDYNNSFMMNKYYKCYSKIDENEHIMKNYILSEGIKNKLKSMTPDIQCEAAFELKFIKEEFFLRCNFSELSKSLEIYEHKFDKKRPISARFEYYILIFFKKTYDLMSADTRKLGKFSGDLKNHVFYEIRKLYLENGKEFGKFYRNKIFFEFYMITNSILDESKTKFDIILKNKNMNALDLEFYQQTIKLFKNLIKRRVLKATTNNLLFMKIRRSFSSLFKIVDLEQSILKDILKIYRKNNDNENLKIYLTEYTKNFEKSRDRKDLLIILKCYLQLEDRPNFEYFYSKYENIITAVNTLDSKEHNVYKYRILNFRNLEEIKRLPIEKMANVITYLRKINLYERPIDFVMSKRYQVSSSEFMFNNKQMLKESEIIEFCNISVLLIEYIFKELNIGFEYNFPINLESSDLKKLIDAIKLMVVVCTLSNEKKILFKVLPMAINSLIKIEVIVKSQEDYQKIFMELTDVIQDWKPDKIYFIVSQLMMLCNADEKNDKIMYKSAISMLSGYVDKLPHVNAYWLVAFLDTDPNEIDKYEKDKLKISNNPLEDQKHCAQMRIAYQKRIEFGQAIYQNLSQENRKIIESYRKFLEIIRSIQKKLVGNSDKQMELPIQKQIKILFKNVNDLIKNGGLFIIPKLEYMQMNFNYREDRQPFELFSNQSMQVYPENFNRLSIKTKDKYIKYRSESDLNYGNKEIYISEIKDVYDCIDSKDKPIKITFLSASKKEHHFLIKGNVKDTVKESNFCDLLSTINNIFSLEGLDVNHNISLKQYNMVPISASSVLIEWLDKTETFGKKIEMISNRYGVKFEEVVDNVPKTFDSNGPEGNILYRYFLDQYPDPNRWFEAKERYITSYSVWCMTGYVIGLGDRHQQNILLSEHSETTHIDFGWALGLHRILPIPEIIDFRFTKNYRRAFGIFEEQGYFLFIAEHTLKALFKHFFSIETKCMTFILDQLTRPNERDYIAKFVNRIKADRDSFLSDQEKIKTFVYRLCRANSDDDRLKQLFRGWAPWV